MLSPFPRFSQSLSVRPSAADYQVVKFFRLKKISIVLSSTPTAGGGGRRERGERQDRGCWDEKRAKDFTRDKKNGRSHGIKEGRGLVGEILFLILSY